MTAKSCYLGYLRGFLFLLSFLLVGCGYKPVGRYGQNAIPSPVFVDVHLSGVEPQNGVYLKDEIIDTLKIRFNEKITDNKAEAKSQIIVKSYSFDYSPLVYDNNGYVIRYRVTSHIAMDLITPKAKKSETIDSSEDVNIQSSSVTSSQQRDYAIRVAIKKAMDKFIYIIAKEGINNE